MQRWRDLTGRRVLISGGSRGLGLALAHACAERGARLALLARDTGALGAARDQLQQRWGCEVELLCCDLRDPAQRERALEQALAGGDVDVLINNAGIIRVGAERDFSSADYASALELHFWAPLAAMRAVLPGMRRRREGRIVNISAIEGKVAFPLIVPYAASKFALTGLSNALRAELKGEQICVTTVVPGLMYDVGQRPLSNAPPWLSSLAMLPGLSTRYDRAARRVLRACLEGQRWLELDLLTRLLARADALAPESTGRLAEFALRFARR